MSDRARRAMTVAEFLAWQSGQDRLYEFVDGEPVAMAGAKLRHDRVQLSPPPRPRLIWEDGEETGLPS